MTSNSSKGKSVRFKSSMSVDELREHIEELQTHYERICTNCGKTWLGLHCPHDGYQNPCPQCNTKPLPIAPYGDDDCIGVFDIDELVEAIHQYVTKKQIEERNTIAYILNSAVNADVDNELEASDVVSIFEDYQRKQLESKEER